MNFNSLFTDRESKSLRRQIKDVHSYLNKQIDKSLIKQLMLQVLDRGLLPVLEYPPSEVGAMPISYTRKLDARVSIHAPIPELKLITVKEFAERVDAEMLTEHKAAEDIFSNLMAEMREKVERLTA